MGLGVLALQGDVREHVAAVESLGERVRMVRERADVEGLEGLIIPGGESTTLSMLLESSGLFDPLAEALAAGLPVFGTCAGMILLAETVLDGRDDQRRFGAIDLTIRRNGYGRQVASFESDIAVVRSRRRGGPRRLHPGPGGRAGRPAGRRAGHVASGGGRPGRGWRPATAPPQRPVVCRQGPVLCTLVPSRVDGRP